MFSSLLGFKGRIGRGGWWFGQLVGLSTIGALFASALTLHDADRTEVANNDFLFLVILVVGLMAVLIINTCVTVKRYHDRGKSGWWYFMSLVPLIGGIWQLIECGFCSGDEGDNDYGPPPGFAKRMADHERDVSALGGGSLAKVDDDYIAQYAKKHALMQAQQQSAMTPTIVQLGSTRPVFGKR